MDFGKAVAGVALAVCLAGCATTYHPAGFSGGYEDSRLDETTYLVSFRGNGHASRERVESFLLYRCAELTAEAGYDYFVLITSESAARHSEINTPGQYASTTTGSISTFGGSATGSATTRGSYTPGQRIEVTRYKSSAQMRMFRGAKPSNDEGAYTAKEVLQYLGPKVGR